MNTGHQSGCMGSLLKHAGLLGIQSTLYLPTERKKQGAVLGTEWGTACSLLQWKAAQEVKTEEAHFLASRGLDEQMVRAKSQYSDLGDSLDEARPHSLCVVKRAEPERRETF